MFSALPQQKTSTKKNKNKSSTSANKTKKSLLAAHLERSSSKSKSKSTPTNTSHNDDSSVSCRHSVHSETTATTAAMDSVMSVSMSSLPGTPRDSCTSASTTISTLSTTNETETNSELPKKDLLPCFEDNSSEASVFDRLYNHQKRSQKLWTDPSSPKYSQSPRNPTRVKATTTTTTSPRVTSPVRNTVNNHKSPLHSPLSPPRSVRTTLTSEAPISPCFDRLYHNEKRNEVLWKDPGKKGSITSSINKNKKDAHPTMPFMEPLPSSTTRGRTIKRDVNNDNNDQELLSSLRPRQPSSRSVSPKRMVHSKSTSSEAPVSPCFDRLYHNEKRTEPLWKDPRKKLSISSPTNNHLKNTVQPTMPFMEPLPSRGRTTTRDNNSNKDPFELLSSLHPRRPSSGSVSPKKTVPSKPPSNNNDLKNWKELQVQHQDLLSSSLLLGGEDEDEDEEELLAKTKRGRERVPQRENRTVRSLSPNQNISAPTTTTVVKASNRKGHETAPNKSKTKRAVRSLSPKRTTSAPTVVLPNNATFERLYRNEKRTEALWKEPTRFQNDHRHQSRSPARTKTSQTEATVPAIFERLFHNEKRSEPLWHAPPKPRSRSVPRKTTTATRQTTVASASSVTERGVMEGSSLQGNGSVRSITAKEPLQIPSRMTRRLSRSTSLKHTTNSVATSQQEQTLAHCLPIDIATSKSDTTALHVVSLSPSHRSCQACVRRERSRSIQLSKHSYLRSRSRSPQPRSSKDDSLVLVVTPDTSSSVCQPRSHSSSPRPSIATSNMDEKDNIKINKRRSRRMSRSLSPTVVHSNEGNATHLTPLSRLQKEIMELQELANRMLNEKQECQQVATVNVSYTAVPAEKDSTTSPKSRTNQPPNNECQDLLPSNGISKELFEGERGLECTETAVALESTIPGCNAITMMSDLKGNEIRRSLTALSQTAAESPKHQGLSSLNPTEIQSAVLKSSCTKSMSPSPPDLKDNLNLNGDESPPAVSVAVSLTATKSPSSENSQTVPSVAANRDVSRSDGVPVSKQTGAPRMKTKRAAEPQKIIASANGAMSHIVRPQMGNQVAATILDRYIEKTIPLVKKSIALHESVAATDNDDEPIEQPVPTRLSYSIYDWWNPSMGCPSLQSNPKPAKQHRNGTGASSGTSIPSLSSSSSSQAPVSSNNVALFSSTINRPFLFPKPPITACFGWLFLQPRHHDA